MYLDVLHVLLDRIFVSSVLRATVRRPTLKT